MKTLVFRVPSTGRGPDDLHAASASELGVKVHRGHSSIVGMGAALLFEMVDMGSWGGSAPPTHMREHTSLTAHLCCTHLDSGPRSVACGRQRRACFPPTP